ncbi:MAG: PAS domain S-box protein, partial [Chitinophagaceae bacterium]
MYLAPDVALQRRMKRWSKILAITVILIALIVFAGWLLGIPGLRRPLPNLVSMNPVTAICFTFLVTGFLSLTSSQPSKKTYGLSIALVSLVLIICLTKCLDLLFTWNIGLDQVLFKNELNEDLVGNTSNKMAPNTAVCFVLSSISLLFFSIYESRHKLFVSQYLSLLVALIGWLSILGYLYHERSFYGILVYIPMAIHTAVCFFLFSMAMLLVQSGKGIMKEVTSKYSGSLMARVMLPAVILVPSVLGYFSMKGYRTGVYSNEFGAATLIIVIIIIFACIVWYSVALLNRRDLQRMIAEKALRESEEQVTAIFENAPDVVVVIDSDGRITKWNPQAEKLFGWKQHEVINKSLGDAIVPPQFQESHRKGLRRYLETGESNILGKSVELFAVRKDKSEVDVALSISPMTIAGQQYFIGFIRDITEKKILENKLKSFNEGLAQQVQDKTKELTDIFERVTDGFIALDTEYRVIYANKKIGEFTHRDPSTLLGKVIWDEFPDAIDSPTFYAFKKAMKEQQYQMNTDHNIPLDLWQENHIYPSPEGLSIFVKNISDRKKSERAINEAKDLADKLIDSLPGVFYFFDATGKFIRWNKQFEVVTGYTTEEIATMHPTDFFGEDEKNYITERITGVFEKGVNDAEANFITKDGKKIPYYFKAVLLQYEGGPCLLGNGIDITERKKAEESLAMSETRFRSIIEQFPYPVVIYNTNGDYVSTNESWEKMWQAKRADVVGYNIRKDQQMISSGLSVYVEKAFAGEVALSQPYLYDPKLIGQRGQKRWMVMTLYPLKNAEGKILEVVLVLQDVTDRKAAEDELRGSEQKYKLLFENNPLPMLMLNLPEYNVIYANNAALKQYGYT